MSKLIFYTNPMSRGQIARWALEEVGAQYEQVLLEYGGSMGEEPFLSINPMGKVPAIKHGDKVVTECAAICAYLGAAFPQVDLAPTADETADYYRWLFFTAGPIEQAIVDRSLGVTPTQEQERMAGYGSYDRAVGVLEHALGERNYVCGDRFTMADVYVGSQVDWGLQFETLPKQDAFESYAERLRQRDSYKRAKAIDTALIAEQSSE